jgi:polyisoprenyl-phosphate glycosyltransferase
VLAAFISTLAFAPIRCYLRRAVLVPRDPPKLLSIVIPMYNEEEVFPLLKEKLLAMRRDLTSDVEMILVDDGSADRTYELMHEWAAEDAGVKLIALSRNFGHQIAITAGMDASSGDAVVIMDADLQDPPSLIPDMIRSYCDGYDVVYGQRTEREGETWFKRATASMFYKLMRRFVDKRLPANTGDFRLMSRRVIEDLRRIREHDRFVRGIVAWVGFPQKALPYKRAGRAAGTTKYPFFKMLKLATNAVLSFSTLPLRIITWVGFLSVLASFGFIARTLYQYFANPQELVLGWASLAILISFFSGVILLSIGMLGIYVGKIHTEVQGRPLYLVRHSMNFPREPR